MMGIVTDCLEFFELEFFELAPCKKKKIKQKKDSVFGNKGNIFAFDSKGSSRPAAGLKSSALMQV